MEKSVYSRSQKAVALLYGLASHMLFAASVVVMCVSLYRGMDLGLIRVHGAPALGVDALLLSQFALGHSFLLSQRGREWMGRLAPAGLGRDLATTIFAALASLQLLITFLLWAPFSILWVAPHGWPNLVLTVSYALSWGLLAKAMYDAGLDAQIGTLGWYSIWRGRKPTYKPFTRTGLFRYSRQPIYLSFSLILWTAPVWTPDHLLVAVVWTAYCLIAPLAKERRYTRYYGAAFQRYQREVPYWIPGRWHRETVNAAAKPPADYEVAIVGAGPVGLLLACLLGQKGFRVLIADRRTVLPAHSQAIGITPPSLQILRRLGLDLDFIRHGVQIQDCHVHGHTGYLGCASFRGIASPYPFILSLPQCSNMALLMNKLAEFPTVTLALGTEIFQLDQNGAQTVTLRGRRDGEEIETSARWVIGCDGSHSRVRELIHMRATGGSYGCHFVMGDFVDDGVLGADAHLFFTPEGAVESFPLPDARRRWIVQTQAPLNGGRPGYLSEIIQRRAGIALPPNLQINESPFSPRWLSCERYYDGRVVLCGDAAHLMSPIGGQGMNTGWADAEFIARMLEAIERDGCPARRLLGAYDRCRRRAAAAARRRAAAGMWLGTRTGIAASLPRDWFLKKVLLGGPYSKNVGPGFAMLTTPFNTVENTAAALWRKPSAQAWKRPPKSHQAQASGSESGKEL